MFEMGPIRSSTTQPAPHILIVRRQINECVECH
jgi:hypothetical protein